MSCFAYKECCGQSTVVWTSRCPSPEAIGEFSVRQWSTMALLSLDEFCISYFRRAFSPWKRSSKWHKSPISMKKMFWSFLLTLLGCVWQQVWLLFIRLVEASRWWMTAYRWFFKSPAKYFVNVLTVHQQILLCNIFPPQPLPVAKELPHWTRSS